MDDVVYFDPSSPNNQTCQNCAQPWYAWCKLRVILKIRKPTIHCGTAFGFIRRV